MFATLPNSLKPKPCSYSCAPERPPLYMWCDRAASTSRLADLRRCLVSVLVHSLRTVVGAIVLVALASTQSFSQDVVRIQPSTLTPMEQGPNVSLKSYVYPNGSQLSLHPIVSVQLSLAPNQSRRISARISLTSTSTSSTFTGAYVMCENPNGGDKTELGDTNQNYAGKNTPAGTSYPFNGVLALYPSLLLQAGNVAETFTCGLYASTDSDEVSVMPQDDDGFSTTYLLSSSVDDTGAAWWQNLNCSWTGQTVPDPKNPDSHCLYLGGATQQQDVYEFQEDGSLVRPWTAPDNAAFVNAEDSLLVTTCYFGTKSCTPENTLSYIDSLFNNLGGTYLQSHLELNQLDSSGNVCRTAQSPDQISFADNTAHHYEIYHLLQDVPVYPECGSRTFQLRLYVKYLSGNPVKIDGSVTGGGNSTFTHAYAYTSATSPTGSSYEVPNLIGLTQAQAVDLITGSDYNVATIDYATSTAPAGIVISETPVPGIMQFPHSGVGFTVSTGGVSVPNLADQNGVVARNTILSLGLTPSVSYIKDCVSPGDVLNQSPPAGTVVQIGATLSITVDSGTYKTCVVK
jgi:hypothetical protein